MNEHETSLAKQRPAERVWDATDRTTSTEQSMPLLGMASTPRMRRFTDIWVAECRRQLAGPEAES